MRKLNETEKKHEVKNTRRKKKYTGHDHLSLFARNFLWSASVFTSTKESGDGEEGVCMGYGGCVRVCVRFWGVKNIGLRRQAVSRAISCLDHHTYSLRLSPLIRLCAAFF